MSVRARKFTRILNGIWGEGPFIAGSRPTDDEVQPQVSSNRSRPKAQKPSVKKSAPAKKVAPVAHKTVAKKAPTAKKAAPAVKAAPAKKVSAAKKTAKR